MPINNWMTTKLWRLLEDRAGSAENVRHYARAWLVDVELLLAKAATVSLDFTLHDDDHSFRVAERMHELISEETLTRLSDYELALLLMSAYLHDIGMNPRRDVVRQVRDYLLSGDIGSLNLAEGKLIQRWLDENYPGVQAPVLPNVSETQRLSRAEFLTAFYCRYRHNDWSGDFIKQKSATLSNPPYPLWSQDLIALCKSHHYGLSTLLDEQFNLRIVGAENKLVNLRYLAAILRVSDILDFDPERTPEVIFLQRAIAPQSKIYWHKDHDIVLGLSGHPNKVLVTARTSDAWTHRAVVQTADDIDHELQTCAQINDQKGFLRGVKLDDTDYYEWNWPRTVTRDISPRPNTFVYIDGAFRPDAQRVITLLAGTQLYGSPLVALRELLQNSFDAVKEQIAISLLQETREITDDIQRAYSQTHRVTLSFDEVDGEVWLVCSDTGVGMTRRTIEQYLLVSGSRPRPEILELERQSKNRGISLLRSGQFGIGVLSYFMLADKMVIETRSSSDAYREQEAHGWRFETEGIDAFGELRPLDRVHRGTTIKLRIRSDQKELLPEAMSYVASQVTKIPCSLDLTGHSVLPEGWTMDSDRVLDLSIPDLGNFEYLKHRDHRPQSNFRKQDNEQRYQAWLSAREEAKKSIQIFGPLVGKLSERRGAFRVFLPYLLVDGHVSLCYLDYQGGFIRPHPNGKEIAITKAVMLRSWRGFSVSRGPNAHADGTVGFVVETDFVDGASISVNRRDLELIEDEEIAIQLDSACKKLFEEFVKEKGSSPYAALTPQWLKLLSKDEQVSSVSWLFPERAEPEERSVWRKINFPALLVLKEISDYERRYSPAKLRSRGFVDELRPIEVSYNEKKWPLEIFAPDRIILREWGSPCLVFSNGGSLRIDDRILAAFPPEWSDIFAITTDDLVVFNRDYDLCRTLTPEAWASIKDLKQKARPHELLNSVASSNSQLSLAWLTFMAAEQNETWNAFRDNFPESFAKVFELANIPKEREILIWRTQHESGLRKISSRGANFVAGDDELPKVQGSQWKLGIHNPDMI